MLYMASLALLEQGRGEEALAAARRALELFRAGRFAPLEAMATWAIRATEARTGHAIAPDLDLAEAAHDVPVVAGLLWFTEATVAFRTGRGESVALARRVLTSQVPLGLPVRLLTEALLAALGSPAGEPEDLAHRASSLLPLLHVQVLAMLARAHGPRPEWQERGAALLGVVGGRSATQRLELCSLEEARRWLGLRAGSQEE
jgi:hypothetical protein